MSRPQVTDVESGSLGGIHAFPSFNQRSRGWRAVARHDAVETADEAIFRAHATTRLLSISPGLLRSFLRSPEEDGDLHWI